MAWDHETIKNTKVSVIGNVSKCRYPGFDEMVVKFMRDNKTDYQLVYDLAWKPISVSINDDGHIKKHIYPNGMLVFYAVEAEIAEYINTISVP